MSWSELFRPELSPLELIVRGSIVYWFLFLLFRVVLRRDVGRLGIADVLFVVLIADASQNAMVGSATSITDGVVVIATLAAWNLALDWSSSRFAWARRLIEVEPRVLVRKGRLIGENLRREMISKDELLSKLRENGVERVAQVKLATLESDGEVSVIRWDREEHPAKHRVDL